MTDALAVVPTGDTAHDRFVCVTADPQFLEVVGQRVMAGETLKQIAHAWQVPVMRFVEWVVNDAVRCGQYQAALRVRADELANETLAIADGEDGNDSKRDSLRVRTRMQLAGHFDAARFGARSERNVNISVRRLANEYTDDELAQIVENARRDSQAIEGKSVEIVAEAKRITSEPVAAGTGII